MKIELPVSELADFEWACGDKIMAIDLEIGDVAGHGGRGSWVPSEDGVVYLSEDFVAASSGCTEHFGWMVGFLDIDLISYVIFFEEEFSDLEIESKSVLAGDTIWVLKNLIYETFFKFSILLSYFDLKIGGVHLEFAHYFAERFF